MEKITKLYAAYKTGCLGNNILDTYFSFVANIIAEEHLSIIEEATIVAKFFDRYSIELPMTFIRQVLGVGVQNGCFLENRGKYNVNIDELGKYCFEESDFSNYWNELINEFEIYCHDIAVDISTINTSDYILEMLDDTDDKILMSEGIESSESISSMEYAWYSFVKKQGESKSKLYSFIAAISASNITRQALFYAGNGDADYSELHIYLDSPIIFALLGMDEEVRENSYKTLISDMQRAKCSIHVLDHNFQEVDGIITRAAGWATNTQYDLRKANNAARFFHDSKMDETEISEFCSNLETKLNELGITVKQTSYSIYQDKFQEDEACLFDMIKERYSDYGYEMTPEKEESIKIDVRSIVMVYRERQGQTATRLQNAKHIMLTSNNAIANVSKKYESNRSINAGHIPSCISADLFGAILWLDSPMRQLEYQKEKLLADCYAFLKPNAELLNRYIKSLDEARNSDSIDEKKYLFLRTHKVVCDSLMDITKGDYARFNSNTYLEVYEDIQAKALKRYKDEAKSHSQTKEMLEVIKEKSAEEHRQSEQENAELKKRILELEAQNKKVIESEIEKRTKIWGSIITCIVAGIPYAIIYVFFELTKAQYSSFTVKSFIVIIGIAIASAIAALLFKISKQRCFLRVRKYFEGKYYSKEGYNANDNAS